MIDYPASLPLMLAGQEYQPGNPQVRGELADGLIAVRRGFSAVPVDFTGEWMITSRQQCFDWMAFYRATTAQGCEWFTMPIKSPYGIGRHPVQFRGAYTVKHQGPCAWRFTAPMRVYLRPQSADSPEFPP